MKKIILSLLAISTISSADSLSLKCSFPGYKDGTIKIYLLPKSFAYDGPGVCSTRTSGDLVVIGEDSIILIGGDCSIHIKRETGAAKVSDFHNGTVEYKGTCFKNSNAF